MAFNTYLGIDQTGSTNARGEPRSLDVALLFQKQKNWHLEANLKLKNLEKASVETLLAEAKIDSPKTLIILDSVLGFPIDAMPENSNLKQLMQGASRYRYNEKEFGAEVAFQFFNSFLTETQKRELPQRLAESQAKANSVFRLQPYQKNIGCGTFRSWKELGKDTTWFHIWPFESTDHVFVICEAYPTLIWKKILGSPNRNGAYLKDFLTKQKDFTINDNCLRACDYADKADAIALCLGAFYLARDGQLFDLPKDSRVQKEGWMMGLQSPCRSKTVSRDNDPNSATS